MKNILKEIFIFVLIIVAIVLVLGVLLYDYIPTSKIVPMTVSYIAPENLKQELETQQVQGNSEVLITYEIDKSDLNKYTDMSKYTAGKMNPFNKKTQENLGAIGGDGSNTNQNTISDKEYFNNNKIK